MTWIKLNDNAPRHPKIAGLSDRAFRAWVNSLCYASEFLTDGALPAAFLVTVPKRSRNELIGAGLWVTDGRAYNIHDYLKHQSSRDAVSQKKAATADRVTRYREKRNAISNGVSNGSNNALVTPPENREQRTDTENRKSVTRSPVQGSGAFEPGSLPRDHIHHSICGPSLRLCLKTWECGELMRQYGGDELKRKDGVRAFVAAFEDSLGPDDAIGDFSAVEKNFQIWLKSIGRLPAKIVPIRDDSALDAALAEVVNRGKR